MIAQVIVQPSIWVSLRITHRKVRMCLCFDSQNALRRGSITSRERRRSDILSAEEKRTRQLLLELDRIFLVKMPKKYADYIGVGQSYAAGGAREGTIPVWRPPLVRGSRTAQFAP